MALSPIVEQLVDHLRILPGVGPKSAQRMAFYLLERNREAGRQLGRVLQHAMEQAKYCEFCRSLCEGELCHICVDPRRDRATLCVVENPADVLIIEQSVGYRGLYYVLRGHLSPLDGIGPEALGLDLLVEHLKTHGIKELILATNPTAEGEATAHYIGELAKNFAVTISRIAHGIPLGSELEYVDGGTIAHSFVGRRPL